MRRTICRALAICLITSASINVSVKAATDENLGKEMFLNYVDELKRDESNNDTVHIPDSDNKIEEQQKILKIMGWDGENCDDSDLNDNYAGTYLDENGKMEVLLDKDAEGNKKIELKINKIDSDISIKMVDYSCKELSAIKQEYDSKMEQLYNKLNDETISSKEQLLLNNIVGSGITLENNCVTVYMKDISQRYVKLFEKIVLKSDLVSFELEKNTNEPVSTKLKLGRAVYKYKYTTYSGGTKTVYTTRSSIGLKAYTIDSNGKKIYGFITCGHGYAKGDKVYIDSLCNTQIGKVIKRKFSGKVDASFVEITNSNYEPSRIVYYSNSAGSTSGGVTISTSYLYVWYTGFKVYKAGSTSYLTSGTLIDYNYSGNITDSTGQIVTMSNMYRANIKVKTGDSGGVFYTKDDGEYCALGIVESSGGSYANFVKWNNIDDSFEIYFY